jgi:hypothetical protein
MDSQVFSQAQPLDPIPYEVELLVLNEIRMQSWNLIADCSEPLQYLRFSFETLANYLPGVRVVGSWLELLNHTPATGGHVNVFGEKRLTTSATPYGLKNPISVIK